MSIATLFSWIFGDIYVSMYIHVYSTYIEILVIYAYIYIHTLHKYSVCTIYLYIVCVAEAQRTIQKNI